MLTAEVMRASDGLRTGARSGPCSGSTLLLARHAETEWNVDRRRQGRMDSPVTERGREQAARVAVLIAEAAPSELLTSPLGRARTTAHAVAMATGLRPRVVHELAELDHGRWSGLVEAEIEARYPGELNCRRHRRYDYRFPGGESYRDGYVRVGAVVRALRGSAHLSVAAVCHEMIARMLVQHLCAWSSERALSWSLPHGTVARIEPGGRQPHTLPILSAGTPRA